MPRGRPKKEIKEEKKGLEQGYCKACWAERKIKVKLTAEGIGTNAAKLVCSKCQAWEPIEQESREAEKARLEARIAELNRQEEEVKVK